jgi:hypothetical protein
MDTSSGYEKKCETFYKSLYLRGIQSVVGVNTLQMSTLKVVVKLE